MNECEKNKKLIANLIDKKLSPEETQELNAHFQTCAQCRKEYDEMLKISEGSSAPSFEEPGDKELKKMWNNPFYRRARNAAVLMLIGGYVILMGYSVFELLTKPKEPLLPRLAIAAIIIGFFILLTIAIKERMKSSKHDPYKEVKR